MSTIFTAAKWGIIMREFMRKFMQLNGVEARVGLSHYLFDEQAFHCDKLQMIYDDERVGLVMKKQEVFMYKQDIKTAEICDNTYTLSDGKLTIQIFV